MVQARAFIPWVSLNTSTLNPVKNERAISRLMLMLSGNLIMKVINTNGTAMLKRQMWLNSTACNSTIAINNSMFLIIVMLIVDCLSLRLLRAI